MNKQLFITWKIGEHFIQVKQLTKKAENVRNKVSKIDKNPNAADVDERIFN